MKYKIYNQDVREWAASYTKGKFHALLCDPPYHLTSIVKRFGKKNSAPAQFGTDGVFSRASKGFMGQEWDGGDVAFDPETWEALGEHLYPGAFGMAFSASRNWHRLAVAIEDAGFIIHPTIFGWLNGQGFPKATNIHKQLDKRDGLEGKVIGEKELWGHNAGTGAGSFSKNGYEGMTGVRRSEPIREPATDLSKAWEGHRYGLQALKPAVEPIIVFQKPYEGRPLDNIVEIGAGALNIDGGRIGTSKNVPASPRRAPQNQTYGDLSNDPGTGSGWDVNTGRWPSNFILDEYAAERLDEQSGYLQSGKPSGKKKAGNNIYGKYKNEDIDVKGIGDGGGASRFFFNVKEQIDEADPIYYSAKVSPKERNAGCDERVNHPTLKPIALAKYLATLLLPPDEYAPRRILVPFSGVGSEMIGCALAGWEQICGIEFATENDYVDIAHKRIEYWTNK